MKAAKRSAFGVAIVAAVLLSLCLLLPVAYNGVMCAIQPYRSEGLQEMEEDRSAALPKLQEYLFEKYALDASDYEVSELKPWTLDSSFTVNETGWYYAGQWQAEVIAGDGTLFYVKYAVSGDRGSYDTLQAERYYSDAESFVRDRLGLPEECEVSVQVDTLLDPDVRVESITENSFWLLDFLFPSEPHKALIGVYDGSDVFSPITNDLFVLIYYPEGSTSEDYPASEDLESVFPADLREEIGVNVWCKVPGEAQFSWPAESSAG